MEQKGFSYAEVLVSCFLLLNALLMVGAMNMTAVNLISKGKLNQKATLALLRKVEELRAMPIEELRPGEFQEIKGIFEIHWRIQNHVPYFGAKQIQCRVVYKAAASTVVETLFYRSE